MTFSPQKYPLENYHHGTPKKGGLEDDGRWGEHLSQPSIFLKGCGKLLGSVPFWKLDLLDENFVPKGHVHEKVYPPMDLVIKQRFWEGICQFRG